MDRTTKEKLEKIQRLMENAGTVGEAEAAAQAFQRLVMKFNLTAEEVAGVGLSEKERYVSEYIQVAKDGTPGVTWKIYLLHTLAKFNFCESIRNSSHGGGAWLVGQKTNVDAVKAMHAQMIVTFERLAREQCAASFRSQPVLQYMSSKRKWTNSFLLGVPSGLYDKFKEERAEEAANDGSVTGLVLVKDEELKRAVDDLIGKTKSVRGSGGSDPLGHAAGYRAGKSYQDAKPMAAGHSALGSGE